MVGGCEKGGEREKRIAVASSNHFAESKCDAYEIAASFRREPLLGKHCETKGRDCALQWYVFVFSCLLVLFCLVLFVCFILVWLACLFVGFGFVLFCFAGFADR
jgi:hypothetical protein